MAKNWIGIKKDPAKDSIDGELLAELEDILIRRAENHLAEHGRLTVRAWAMAEGIPRMRLHSLLDAVHLDIDTLRL